MIENFVQKTSNAYSFISLGQQRYFSCIAQVDGVVGNSSSGLAEVPSFKKGTVNIGNRQLGRLLASSVINCEPKEGKIREALDKLYSMDFRQSLETATNPYGEGGASSKVVEVLRDFSFDGVIQKTFHDL
jgi:GDP/UDP-N,N'-diacetylbacillosamine 2-epimerase (hydrolysing)